MSDMLNGLWTVEFETTMNRYGRGVLVINNGRALGGDTGYYYSGTCNAIDHKIDADLIIIRYHVNSTSVFGNLDYFQLRINGKLDKYDFRATGSIPEIPEMGILIKGKKKEDLES
uniref:T3SS negative regulator,GrlR n=1 Tax=Candidatus Kentrum sp. LFY TaxID=2126342 RepID=A0A450WTU7_9GAMM|nr:MAG: T3SS negative regulator,GrlR [Candidatus Kentron sp. LFY]